MEQTLTRYEAEVKEVEEKRKDILARAKAQAEEILNESNKKIENAIREIRESQAEKEETKKIRSELSHFKLEVLEIDTKESDDLIAKKIQQIQERKIRHQKRKAEKEERDKKNAEEIRKATQKKIDDATFKVGDRVRIKGLTSTGKIESIEDQLCTVIFGDMRTKMKLDRLEHAPVQKAEEKKDDLRRQDATKVSRMTRDTIDERRKNFHQDIDVRGMRGDEALNAVQYFIDDAILVGMSRVRILHGKGNGILRQLIRQYLSTVPNITHYGDEHVQFGGAGITVVDF